MINGQDLVDVVNLYTLPSTLNGAPTPVGLSPGDVHRHAMSLLQNRMHHQACHFGASSP
jgi:hypothetical protein